MKRCLLFFLAAPLAVLAAEPSREPAQALEQLTVHPELKAQLFASEPMMLSPSSIDIDARGRVWVCEVVNYRSHKGERPEGDRILILEDTDGDAKADKSTVFHQGTDVDSAHGICVLGNRALISCGDDVFWLIDDNGDDKADRKEVLFTKIGGVQHDHGIHAFHFGPDGRLYFNFGNGGKQLCDKDGNLITDIHGVRCTNQNNRPYQEGMVFRCELDGSNVEVLGWNFRNNWEVAVDSFGALWQSDNDDDGNKSVRINHVMEFGNYGYKDEMTGAGWQTPRLNLEKEIPQRHWHQNDPGVVPNLLVTGAGSPTGMQVYEGRLLPSIFHGQPLHCDAGPNVVRAYITQPQGSGYKAEIVNLLEGSGDRWFRPSDVCVAPDGSLIICDWYDPGVGGHGMGDTGRGRLFRLTVSSAEKYVAPPLVLDTVDQAVAELRSPNEARRYLAWQALMKQGSAAEPALKRVFQDRQEDTAYRARAFWAAARSISSSKTTEGENPVLTPLSIDTFISFALSDPDPRMQAAAYRVARQIDPRRGWTLAAGAPSKPAGDLRREQAIALRFDGSDDASRRWAELACEAPLDRWLLEALGIGADLHWDSRLEALDQIARVKENAAPMVAQLICRSRAAVTPARVTELLLNQKELLDQASLSAQDCLRALQLRQPQYPMQVRDAALRILMQAEAETALAAATLLSREELAREPQAKARLDDLLKPVIGTPAFVELVERLSLTGFEKELFEFIQAHPSAPEANAAARLIAANRDGAVAFLRESEPDQAKALVAALGRVGDRASVAVLNGRFLAERREDVSRAMLEALGLSSEGARVILRWNKEGKLPPQFTELAALVLSRSTDAGVRSQAAAELPLPAAQGLQDFPPLAELMKLPGNVGNGQTAFMAAGCVACHQVKGQFINFGPDLTQIGAKLSKEGLFAAILYPSAAIEHSYVGQQVSTRDGQTIVGYVISETDTELTLRIAGGGASTIRKADISQREEMRQSLMPPGLAGGIGPQGLADLVAWLQTLR
jgi:putative membrane-bound dehydrogenase-like protein